VCNRTSLSFGFYGGYTTYGIFGITQGLSVKVQLVWNAIIELLQILLYHVLL
jgi:hypothetical protein